MMVDFKVLFGNRVYIGAGATIIGLFTVLTLLGFSITSSGDIHCGTDCVSYFNVTNKNYRSVYIYNYDEIKLDFSPEIKDYELYVKYYGKWVFTNFTMETRLGNIPEDRKYVFVFPAYSTKEFKLVGHKNNPLDVIKWSLNGKLDLDPIWDVPILEEVKKCKDVTYITTENVMGTCYYYWNESNVISCKDVKDNSTCLYQIVQLNESYDCVTGTKEVITVKNECVIIGWNYDKFYSASDWCCYDNFCGLKKDYDCNYITQKLKKPEWSYKELDTGIVKIDDYKLKADMITKISISNVGIVK